MTLEEWLKEAKHLKSMYPNERFMPKEEYVRVWYDYLKDIDYVYIRIAVKKWVAENSYYPTVGDIRSLAIDEKNDAYIKLGELRSIFRACLLNYPSNLISEDDWQFFKDCIKSEQFEDAKNKALNIKRKIMKENKITIPFKEYINEISRKESD